MKKIILIALLSVVIGCDDADEKGLDGEKSSEKTVQRDQKSSDSNNQPNARRGEGRRPGGRAGGRGGDPKAGVQFRDRPVPVAVTKVERGRVDAFYASTASLTAEEEAVVVARTQGVVEQIFVEEGDYVAAGAPLAQLDTRRLELEVARTRTNIESYERAFERSKRLYETKMISPDAYDQALYNLERENASLNLQLYELDEATIKAPIDGVITLRHIKLGNTLNSNDRAFELKRSEVIEAVLNVPEKELSKLEKGQLAIVLIDALDAAEFEGVVNRVSPEIDPSSGTFRVTVSLNNSDNILKPGMFARVNVRYDSNENTLLLAREAVVTQKDENSVFVVKAGQATRQTITIGYAMGSSVEVLEGLDEGDQVVITGQGGLRDGASVRLVPL
ncbi:MAG: efflux transporter periplasmic adaptor subunit [Gammaproteobacteria bacterium]|jgi:membrane fusion protein (multidrug efflux system)|nr:efflux transporter periplasmic adaptor subunit [Gammaproteobacteria bacterium]